MVDATVTMILEQEDREILEKAFSKIHDFTKELQDKDIFADEDCVFYCLYENYKENSKKLSRNVDYSEQR